MNFEDYLISKKIDSAAFLKAEADVWKTWRFEFEQVHPNSFTAQKLYLINPIRRKYPLKQEPGNKEAKSELTGSDKTAAPTSVTEKTTSNPAPSNPKPSIPRPVFKPKPKMN